MSDELTIQHNRLEERVAERIRELEKAKLAAESANESKTLFIASISHELKTPLNGILGMCAVCMGEEDISRIKKSLQVVYQSGDLLLHLLNDLLTSSKNQIDQAIQIEEKEFRLSDVRSQLAIIFQNQVQEKQINFSVNFVSGGVTEPKGTICGLGQAHPGSSPTQPGRLADMVLWGDQHRILQVLINLVSNSLKFTYTRERKTRSSHPPRGGRGPRQAQVPIHRSMGLRMWPMFRPKENSVTVEYSPGEISIRSSR
jgi:osomolarity two-component system sensor histidine kinase SLN1